MRAKGRFLAFVIGCAVAAGPAPAWAGENEMMDILIHKLVQKGVLSREDAKEIKKEVAEESVRMAKSRSAEAQDAVKKMKGGGWLDTVKWGGDLRVRHETQKREPAVDRNRQRFRLRFGFTAKPVDPIEIGVRLASGASGDPTSTNQSFSGTFDKKPLFIDLAYAKYKAADWAGLIGGKMKNPFFTVKEGMVWDGDVTPEGAALELESPNPIPGLDRILVIKPFANAGAFAVSELSGDYGDQGLFGFQAGANMELPMGMKLKTAGAYYEMTGIEGKRTADITAAPAGNSTRNTATIFAYDYDMATFTNELALPKILGRPVSLRGDYVHNTGASDDNGGWLAGLDVGKVTEKFGSWKAGYSYRRIEPDATFGAITDSDFGTGGTNHKGHILYASMGLNKYASVGLKYFRTDEIEGSQGHNDTFQADLQLKY